MAMSHSPKTVVLIPLALALALYPLLYARDERERRAERSFQSFSRQLEQKQFSTAREDIERAVELSPGNAYYLSSQGLLLARESRSKFDAAAFLEKRLTFGEEELKLFEEAAQYYEKSLALNPLDDSYHHNLGWLYSFLGKRDQALRCFRKAIEIDGSVALYHVSVGLLFEQGGEIEDAYREYGVAVRLSPAIVDSRFFRDLHDRSPEAADRVVSEGISHLEEELRQNPSPILEGKLGKLYLHVNELGKASDALKQALMELPSLPRPWYSLGVIYELHGDEAAARECYDKATFLDGNDAQSWSRLGNYYDRHNNSPGAIRAYTRAVSRWINMMSEHAGRVPNVYQAQFIIADDIVPNGFLSYCSPSLDISEICLRLAKLHEDAGNVELSSYYNNLRITLTR
jgi:tetratricopeptide (TPR) repeat protein